MRKALKIARKVFLWILITHLVYVLYVWFLPPPITLTQLGSVLKGDGLKRNWVSFKNISPNAGLAVMAAEDQLFTKHNGFDWKSIEKAMAHNEKRPTRIRGASTLSQQVAKNVFLWQGRSYIRKGLEVYFTFLIETLYSKRRILTLYLNEAQMGKGVYGVGAAAEHYYKKNAAALTRLEAAQLAAALPNPVKYSVKPPSSYVSRRSGWILRQMRNLESEPDVQLLLKKP